MFVLLDIIGGARLNYVYQINKVGRNDFEITGLKTVNSAKSKLVIVANDEKLSL